MSNNSHVPGTATGTCQICGARIALVGKLQRIKIHGYEIAAGVRLKEPCTGSGCQPRQESGVQTRAARDFNQKTLAELVKRRAIAAAGGGDLPGVDFATQFTHRQHPTPELEALIQAGAARAAAAFDEKISALKKKIALLDAADLDASKPIEWRRRAQRSEVHPEGTEFRDADGYLCTVIELAAPAQATHLNYRRVAPDYICQLTKGDGRFKKRRYTQNAVTRGITRLMRQRKLSTC